MSNLIFIIFCYMKTSGHSFSIFSLDFQTFSDQNALSDSKSVSKVYILVVIKCVLNMHMIQIISVARCNFFLSVCVCVANLHAYTNTKTIF